MTNNPILTADSVVREYSQEGPVSPCFLELISQLVMERK